MIRFGLHLGFRQKNLRQLMVCARGERPRSERQLSDAKRGEIRWSDRDEGWEVFVPSVAFKNSGSTLRNSLIVGARFARWWAPISRDRGRFGA